MIRAHWTSMVPGTKSLWSDYHTLFCHQAVLFTHWKDLSSNPQFVFVNSEKFSRSMVPSADGQEAGQGNKPYQTGLSQYESFPRSNLLVYIAVAARGIEQEAIRATCCGGNRAWRFLQSRLLLPSGKLSFSCNLTQRIMNANIGIGRGLKSVDTVKVWLCKLAPLLVGPNESHCGFRQPPSPSTTAVWLAASCRQKRRASSIKQDDHSEYASHLCKIKISWLGLVVFITLQCPLSLDAGGQILPASSSNFEH